MKKVSISLFAILAITVSVFSAFTTQKKAAKSIAWHTFDLRTSVNQTFGAGQTQDFTQYSLYTSGTQNPINDAVCVGSSTNLYVCALLLDPTQDVEDDEVKSFDEIAYEIE